LLFLLDRLAVVLNGHDAIREALVKRSADFAGRIELYAEKVIWNQDLKGLCTKNNNCNVFEPLLTRNIKNPQVDFSRQLGLFTHWF